MKPNINSVEVHPRYEDLRIGKNNKLKNYVYDFAL